MFKIEVLSYNRTKGFEANNGGWPSDRQMWTFLPDHCLVGIVLRAFLHTEPVGRLHTLAEGTEMDIHKLIPKAPELKKQKLGLKDDLTMGN